MALRLAGVVALACVAGAALITASPPAVAADRAADADTKVPSWDLAASTLGTAGSLWEPKWTADLDRTRRVSVLADNLTFADGAVTGGDTFAGTRYGKGKTSLWVEEKWARTGWAAEPVVSTSRALVERVRLRMGPPGMRYTVVARVFADCFAQPADANPVPIPRKFRCARSDVRKDGGTLEMTMRPASTMTAPGTTSIVMRSSGLTYRQLLRAARNLEQVAGTPTVAGSAQMVGMCQQMVSQKMSLEQATAFAASNGYLARLGSLDGESMAVTADYRPDRFTLDVVSGAVTGCTYG